MCLIESKEQFSKHGKTMTKCEVSSVAFLHGGKQKELVRFESVVV